MPLEPKTCASVLELPVLGLPLKRTSGLAGFQSPTPSVPGSYSNGSVELCIEADKTPPTFVVGEARFPERARGSTRVGDLDSFPRDPEWYATARATSIHHWRRRCRRAQYAFGKLGCASSPSTFVVVARRPTSEARCGLGRLRTSSKSSQNATGEVFKKSLRKRLECTQSYITETRLTVQARPGLHSEDDYY